MLLAQKFRILWVKPVAKSDVFCNGGVHWRIAVFRLSITCGCVSKTEKVTAPLWHCLFRNWRFALAAALCLCAAVPVAGSQQRHVLRYNTPARVWTEALPIGNGRLGAMVYGRPKREQLQLNEDREVAELQLLPALPDAWPSGSVQGLRARGGFELDMQWRDGSLTRARLHSNSSTPCRIRCDRPLSVSCQGQTVALQPVGPGMIEFVPRTGAPYELIVIP